MCCRDAMHGVSTVSPYLHHKNVYVRVGGNLPIHAHYGFHHYAMWGGTSPEYGDLPDSWDTYKKIFLARKGDTANAPIKEVKNSLGNHLGSRNFGLDYQGGLIFRLIFTGRPSLRTVPGWHGGILRTDCGASFTRIILSKSH